MKLGENQPGRLSSCYSIYLFSLSISLLNSVHAFSQILPQSLWANNPVAVTFLKLFLSLLLSAVISVSDRCNLPPSHSPPVIIRSSVYGSFHWAYQSPHLIHADLHPFSVSTPSGGYSCTAHDTISPWKRWCYEDKENFPTVLTTSNKYNYSLSFSFSWGFPDWTELIRVIRCSWKLWKVDRKWSLS